jgi:ubiquinone/menaquinone biosynthesis C-methylase UbiE
MKKYCTKRVDKKIFSGERPFLQTTMAKKEIEFNIKAHDKVAGKYEKVHDEIFNDIEQDRIRSVLGQIIETVKSSGKNLKALDVGCGSGNLTRHLIDLGVYTVSADVSESFLKLVEQRFSSTHLSKPLKINGRDLANVQDCTFDIAAAYSVLHHVPDYLYLIKEMCRVLKKGGVIYLDHEANETYYQKTKEYVEFLKMATPKSVLLRKYLRLLADFDFYVNFIKKRINPKYKCEGDIHVWPDDHIEWDKIEQLLTSEGFEIVLKRDYLLYRGSYRRDIYEQYKQKCGDMTMLIAIKR